MVLCTALQHRCCVTALLVLLLLVLLQPSCYISVLHSPFTLSSAPGVLAVASFALAELQVLLCS